MAREVPQYVSQLSIGAMPKIQPTGLASQAQALQQISVQAAAQANDMQQKASRIHRLDAKTELRTNLHRMSQEAGADPAALKSSIEGYKKGYFQKYNDPELQAEFDLEALPFIDKATDKYDQNLTVAEQTSLLNANSRNLAMIGQVAPNLFSSDPIKQKAAFETIQKLTLETADNAVAKRPDGTPIFGAREQVAMAGEVPAQILSVLPDEKKLEALGYGVGGFEASLSSIHANEIRSKTPDAITGDGDGTRAYRGINSKANPGEFKKIEEMLAQGKNQEARAYVDAIYKEKYWDEIGADNLPVQFQGVIMDAAVNQGTGYAKELIKEVNKGASVGDIIQMRRERYAKTKGTDVERASWENRLIGFEHLTAGELIPPDVKMKIVDSTLKSMEQEYKAKQEDPAKWGRQHGKNLEQIVQMQGDPFYAKVIPKDEAKVIADKSSQLETSDDVANFAQGLQQEYGDYTRNAIIQLKEAGMKPAYEAATVLAMKNPVGYKTHIELLANAGKVTIDAKGDKTTGAQAALENFKLKGFKEADLKSEVQDQIAELMEAKRNEGWDANDEAAQVGVITQLALMKMDRDGGSYEEAVSFALSPDVENYKQADLNGVKYNIPTRTPSGNLNDTAEIESRVRDVYAQIRPKIAEIYKKEGRVLTEDIIPYLNERQDGLEFMTSTTREPILDGAGKKVTLNFDAAISDRSREERIKKIRQEEMKRVLQGGGYED